MGAAGFGGAFAPIVQYEKWEIHKVFPHFPYFRLGQNLVPNLVALLCGVALVIEFTWHSDNLEFGGQTVPRAGGLFPADIHYDYREDG